MKLAKLQKTILTLFLLTQIKTAPLFYSCDKNLLESYDLEGSKSVLKYRNLICPTVAVNCCTYMTQLQIYKKWVVNKERKKILALYKQFVNAYTKMMATFEDVEKMAQIVKDNTGANPVGSNCYKISNAILVFEVSALKKVIVRAARKAYKYLYESRRGFYCSICNAKQQKYFNKAKRQIIVNESFCKGLILNTMNFFLFKFSNFMKISRLYAKFLVNCDLRGKYFPNKYLKHEIQFFRKKEIIMDINNCKASLKSPEALKYCNGYCSHFNPVVYNQYFEGEVDKLFSFQKSIENLAKKNQSAYDDENKKHGIGIKKGRLLEEDLAKARKLVLDKNQKTPKERKLEEMKHPDFNEDGKLDEDINEISQFNKEFKTALIRPITYSFETDLSVKHKMNFTQSIVGTGLDKIYDLTKYKTVVKLKGLNFHVYGKAASINKGAAMRVFKKADPSKNRGAAEFLKFMLKS